MLINRIEEAYSKSNENDAPYAPLVFPEGTTSAGLSVSRFHRGVFVPGRPIRPFTIKYPAKHFSLNFDTISIPRLFYQMLT